MDRIVARCEIETEEAKYKAPEIRNGARGRPQKFISRNTLEHFLDLGFSVPSIASILGM